MDGLDFFSPSAGGESYDPAAFERFKEQIKKNGQFVAAIRKDEQRKKKKEDALAQILLQFIQRNQNSALMILVSRLLEENIPASFILAIIVLGNEEIRAAIAEHEKNQLLLEAQERKSAYGESSHARVYGEPGGAQLPSPSLLTDLKDSSQTSEFSLVARFNDSTIPLKIKMALDEWGVGIYQAGTTQPFRILETVLNKEGEVKDVVIDSCANVLQNFLVSTDSGTFAMRGYASFYSFSEFMLKGILQKLKEQIENQRQLN